MTDRKATTFVFSPFRMDPARRLLTRDGQPIALKPKEFDTLLVLVEEDGRVVTKMICWPGYGPTASCPTAAWRRMFPFCARP